MTPEEKILLSKAIELAEENNKMLKSLTRSMKISRIISVIYWVFIIGSAVGAFYLIQPYIDGLMDTYENASSGLNSILGS
jgi:CRISPR/Cas system-associated protein Cas10 (large subunit of type III CRISPR-Cas system)